MLTGLQSAFLHHLEFLGWHYQMKQNCIHLCGEGIPKRYIVAGVYSRSRTKYLS